MLIYKKFNQPHFLQIFSNLEFSMKFWLMFTANSLFFLLILRLCLMFHVDNTHTHAIFKEWSKFLFLKNFIKIHLLLDNYNVLVSQVQFCTPLYRGRRKQKLGGLEMKWWKKEDEKLFFACHQLHFPADWTIS